MAPVPMSCYLYPPEKLPECFAFPQSFLDFVSKTPIPYLEPWWFLCKFQEEADFWLTQVQKQYPGRQLVPFAKRSISDDVACFDAESGSRDPKVFYVHTFASPGWEDRGSVANFVQWLKEAEEESVEYKLERDS